MILNKRSQLERYLLAGTVIFIIGHIQYRLLYGLLEGVPMHAGTTWLIHFIIGTMWCHAVHRFFTFRGAPQLPYFHSLFLTYGLFALVLILSTLMMVLLCDIGCAPPWFGWLITTMLAAIFNFWFMSHWTICSLGKGYEDEPERTYLDCSNQE